MRKIIFLILLLMIIPAVWAVHKLSWETTSNPDLLLQYLESPQFDGDVKFESDYDVQWDKSEYTLEFLDNAVLAIGTGDDFTIEHDGTDTVASGDVTVNGALTVANAFEQDFVIFSAILPSISLTPSNSGQVHIVPDLVQDTTFTLPTEASLRNYKLVYIDGAADAQDWIIDSGNDTNFFIGGVSAMDPDDGDVTSVYSNGSTNSKMTIYTPGAGTVIEMWCDGTNWYVSGMVVSATDTAVAFGDQ